MVACESVVVVGCSLMVDMSLLLLVEESVVVVVGSSGCAGGAFDEDAPLSCGSRLGDRDLVVLSDGSGA